MIFDLPPDPPKLWLPEKPAIIRPSDDIAFPAPAIIQSVLPGMIPMAGGGGKRRLLAVAHSGSPFLAVYDIDGMSKLPNPATLPLSSGLSVAFSPDGNTLAVGHTHVSNYGLTVYSVPNLAKIADPQTHANVNGLRFSPDGSTLAAARDANSVFVVETATWTGTGRSHHPNTSGRDVAWQPDGQRAAAAHGSNYIFTPYTTTSWQRPYTVSDLPTGTGYGVDWSPDAARVAVAYAGGAYLKVYNASDWSTVAGTPTLPGTGRGVRYSPDGTILAVAHSGSPYLSLFNTSDWSTISGPSTLPTGDAYHVAWSQDGDLLAVAHNTSPFVSVYETATWTKLANPSALPAGNGRGVAFSG